MAILKNVPIAKLYRSTRIFSCIRMIRLSMLLNIYYIEIFKNPVKPGQEYMRDAYIAGLAFIVLLILSNVLILFGVFLKCRVLIFPGFILDVFISPIFCVFYIWEKLQNPHGIILIIAQLLVTAVDVAFWIYTLDLYLRLEFGDDVVEDKIINLESYEYVFIIGPEVTKMLQNQANLKKQSSVRSANEKSENEDKSADVEKNMTTKC